MDETGVVTIDHEEIRDWIEDRGGQPAISRETNATGTRLRVDFGTTSETIRRISWEEFFKLFEADDLAFLYDSSAGDVDPGTVSAFVVREAFMEQLENGGMKEDGELEDEPESADEEET